MASLCTVEGDLSLKAGVIGRTIRQTEQGVGIAEKTPADPKEPNATQEVDNKCLEPMHAWCTLRKKCIRVSLPCLFRSRQKVYAFDDESTTDLTAPRQAKVVDPRSKKRHEQDGHIRRRQEIWIEQQWEKFVPEGGGGIKAHDVRQLMEELNSPKPVSAFAVDFVMSSCDADKTGCISLNELKTAVPLYLALQTEQQLVDEAFERLDEAHSGAVPVTCLSQLLADVNDGVPPTAEEANHIISRVRSTTFDGWKLGVEATTLSRAEVWKAVAVFYPRVHARRAVAAPCMRHGKQGGIRCRVRTNVDSWLTVVDTVIAQNAETWKPILDKQQLKQLIHSVEHRRQKDDLSASIPALNPNDPQLVDESAVDFVLHAANIHTPDLIAIEEVKTAIALHMAVQTELVHLDQMLDECDLDRSTDFSQDEVFSLLERLDGDSPSHDEVNWVMQVAESGCSLGPNEHDQAASLKRKELRRAVLLWMPRVMMRRAIEADVDLAAAHAAGRRRRAIALQLGVHELWVQQALKGWPDMLTRRELRAIMIDVGGGSCKVSDSDIDLVLVLAEHPRGQTKISKSDLVQSLAMWRSLRDEMDFIGAHFASYDVNSSGGLDEAQLRALLTDINVGHPPSQTEIDWFLSCDLSGKQIDKTSLLAAVAIWFHHVSPLQIRAKMGCARLVPIIYSLVASVASCVVVAATTVLFSEEKTAEWLTAVGMSLVWRNFLIDPLKAVMFGRTFEFVFGLIFGG